MWQVAIIKRMAARNSSPVFNWWMMNILPPTCYVLSNEITKADMLKSYMVYFA